MKAKSVIFSHYGEASDDSNNYASAQADLSLAALLASVPSLTHICLVPHWKMDAYTDNVIFPYYGHTVAGEIVHGFPPRTPTATPRITPNDSALEHIIDQIHAAGKKTMLMPQVEPFQGWRGFVDAANPALWFDYYKTFMNHYAVIAESKGVACLVLENELKTMMTVHPEYLPYWIDVISEAKTRYSGPTTMCPNWDEFTLVPKSLWDEVDYLGLSFWGEKLPTIAGLEAFIKTIDRRCPDLGKTVILGEFGYVNNNWLLQGQGYIDMLTRLYRVKPWLAGINCWDWRYDLTAADPAVTYYDPALINGRPAAAVLESYYSTPLALAPTRLLTPMRNLTPTRMLAPTRTLIDP